MQLSSSHEVDKWVPTSGDGKIPRTAGWLGILSYDDDDDDESNKSVSNPCQTLFLLHDMKADSRGPILLERGASESGNVLTDKPRVEQILCIIQSEG